MINYKELKKHIGHAKDEMPEESGKIILDIEFIEDLRAQIAFQAGKDISGNWTPNYREGYVDGLNQALLMYQDNPEGKKKYEI